MGKLQDIRILLGIGIGLLPLQQANAQIIPDINLPNTSQIQTEQQNLIITEGTARGSNLFHSFEQFSIPVNNRVIFDQATNIENIISRVTGNNISQIDGILQVNGNANFFLLNPNGIIFGKNAQLNLGGSFMATTGESLHFADGTSYSATQPNQPSLTINVPMGVQFGTNPGKIVNQSRATDINGQQVGLQVPTGNTLVLLGGEIDMDGGMMITPGGQVELGSVKENGTVDLDADFSLKFPENIERDNITLRNGAEINVSAGSGGGIRIFSQDLKLSKRSIIRAGINEGLGTLTSKGGDININARDIIITDGAHIFSVTFGNGDAGNINIEAEREVRLEGIGSNSIASGIYSIVQAEAVGNAGIVNITADSVTVKEGAVIFGATFGQGDGSNINLTVRDRVSLDGVGFNFAPSGIFSRGGIPEAVGNSGNIQITAAFLDVTNGAVITGSTNAQGNAGNVTLNIVEAITLDGVGKANPANNFSQSSGVYSSIRSQGIGKGGEIDITTNTLDVKNGAVVITSTFNQGDAGKIVIQADNANLVGVGKNGQTSGILTPTEPAATGAAGEIMMIINNRLHISKGAVISSLTRTRNDFPGGNITITAHLLELLEGGQIITNSSGAGQAGNINLNVANSITASGVDPNFANRPQSLIGDVISNAGEASGFFANTTEASTGNGGNLRINTPKLSILDGAIATVSARGIGDAGNLEIFAPFLLLDNGSLSAETRAGEFGNILIQSEDMRLFNNSNITTNAQETATGGNIFIQTNTLVALQNSDISADAQENAGGRVSIIAQAIFGTEFRDELTPKSDITATSELGAEFDGEVSIQTPNLDPTRGLLELPDAPTEIPDFSARTCLAGSSGNDRFRIITGEGKPPTAGDVLNYQSGWQDTRFVEGQDLEIERDKRPQANASQGLEAQGWRKNANGNILLTTEVSYVDGYRNLGIAGCSNN